MHPVVEDDTFLGKNSNTSVKRVLFVGAPELCTWNNEHAHTHGCTLLMNSIKTSHLEYETSFSLFVSLQNNTNVFDRQREEEGR